MPQPIRIITSPSLTLAGRNKTFKIGFDSGIKELWQNFMGHLGKISGQLGCKV